MLQVKKKDQIAQLKSLHVENPLKLSMPKIYMQTIYEQLQFITFTMQTTYEQLQCKQSVNCYNVDKLYKDSDEYLYMIIFLI